MSPPSSLSLKHHDALTEQLPSSEQISSRASVQRFYPNEFQASRHFYPKVIGAKIHPSAELFFQLSLRQIIDRYCLLHKKVDPHFLRQVLTYRSRHLHWCGVDLFQVIHGGEHVEAVLLETNSCPSGQKSMPFRALSDADERYRMLLERSFLPLLSQQNLPEGSIAVLYDKNEMECSGYAATLANLLQTAVYLVPCYEQMEQPPYRFEEGRLSILTPEGRWLPIRAAFRYVTQRPWSRIPLETQTLIFNPALACLAGGRNKLVAARAYEALNKEIQGSGLALRYPDTLLDVCQQDIPRAIRDLGGMGVVKVPYSNAGQGVYPITHTKELSDFLDQSFHYDKFIVQSLIGPASWYSKSRIPKYSQLGTLPNKDSQTYVADLRLTVGSGEFGIFPLLCYARRAKLPLIKSRPRTGSSWDMLGTNLSMKRTCGSWATDTDRLILADTKEFSQLGLSIDSLLDCFIQAALALIAIDRMAKRLIDSRGKFQAHVFQSLDPDQTLLEELLFSKK